VNILTGIKPTGMPHLGNYLSVIKPAVERSNLGTNDKNFFFIADYHALTSVKSRKELQENIYSVAATWLASGLMSGGTQVETYFYVQSDIPEIFQLNWILSCYTPKGYLNLGHAYKAASDLNIQSAKDVDDGVSAGLYNYPVLMASDILLFKANKVPVGLDQVQHIEITRDIARRINHQHKGALVLPEAEIEKDVETIYGLDGRKMSKSYNNTIPLCCPRNKLKKLINTIPTDSTDRNAPKNPDTSVIFHYFKHFATETETSSFRAALIEGLAWGEAKEALFKVMDHHLTPIREEYDWYMAHPERIDMILKGGKERASVIAKKNLEDILRCM